MTRHWAPARSQQHRGTQQLAHLFGQLGGRDGIPVPYPAQALQGLDILQLQQPCQHIVDAPFGGVQVGVGTEGGNAVPGQQKGGVGALQPAHRLEDHRMVAHHQLAAQTMGLLHHGGGDVQSDQHPAHQAPGVHQQAGVIPFLGQGRGRPLLHKAADLLQFVHGNFLLYVVYSR